MFGLHKSKKRVNIVLKDHVIRYMECESTGLQGVTNFGEKFLPLGVIEEGKVKDPTTLELILDELVRDNRWKNKTLYFCVPDASVVIRPQLVSLDLAEEEIKGYLYMQLGDQIHLPFERPVFDFKLLGEKDGQQEILMFAYPEDRVQTFEEVFKEADLKPVVADLSSLSLYRLYYSLDKAKQKDHLLSIQWNVDSIVLTVFHECRPQFIRYMRTSLDGEFWQEAEDGDSGLAWIGEKSDLEGYEQDQLREVERIMSFYRFSVTQGEANVTNILLSGDWPNMEELYEHCKGRFDVPVEWFDLQSQHGQELASLPPRFADVYGLSIKA